MIAFKVDHFSFGWSSLFVIITELAVFIVATIFLFIKPTKLPPKLEHLEDLGEATPLLPNSEARACRDDRSPSIGYDSSVSNLKNFCEFQFESL